MAVAKQQILQGKTALVTGGSSGIGAAIALAYASEGAALVLTGRSIPRLKQVTREAPEGGDAIAQHESGAPCRAPRGTAVFEFQCGAKGCGQSGYNLFDRGAGGSAVHRRWGPRLSCCHMRPQPCLHQLPGCRLDHSTLCGVGWTSSVVTQASLLGEPMCWGATLRGGPPRCR